jgi:hypothetical protein
VTANLKGRLNILALDRAALGIAGKDRGVLTEDTDKAFSVGNQDLAGLTTETVVLAKLLANYTLNTELSKTTVATLVLSASLAKLAINIVDNMVKILVSESLLLLYAKDVTTLGTNLLEEFINSLHTGFGGILGDTHVTRVLLE